MLEEQICKSANRCQRSVLKINSRAEQKSSESGFKSSSYGGRAHLYDKKESGLITLYAPINIHIQILHSELHTFPLRIS